MQLTFLKGYPDYIGKRFAFCATGNGPKSYVGGAAGGDPIVIPRFNNYIDSIESDPLSVSGNFYYAAQPSIAGARATWVLRYFSVALDAEVVNGVDLSAEQFVVSGLGGVY